MPMPYSHRQNDDECAVMSVYLVMLVLGIVGLVIVAFGMRSLSAFWISTVTLVSSGLMIVSFFQLSKAWVSPRTWLKIFALIFLLGGLRTAYTSYQEVGFGTNFYIGLVMSLLGLLGLIFPRKPEG